MPRDIHTETVGWCLKRSCLWRDVEILFLKNMRIIQAAGEKQDEAGFAKFLLDLGQGQVPGVPEESQFAIELNKLLTWCKTQVYYQLSV